LVDFKFLSRKALHLLYIFIFIIFWHPILFYGLGGQARVWNKIINFLVNVIWFIFHLRNDWWIILNIYKTILLLEYNDSLVIKSILYIKNNYILKETLKIDIHFLAKKKSNLSHMVRFVASKVPYFHQRRKRLVYQSNICFIGIKYF
jgi:hypothetical protein